MSRLTCKSGVSEDLVQVEDLVQGDDLGRVENFVQVEDLVQVDDLGRVEDGFQAAFAVLERAVDGGGRLDDLRMVSEILGRTKNRASALLCGVAQKIAEAHSRQEAVEVLSGGVRMSGRDARQAVKVGEALKKMPRTSRRFADGSITYEQTNSLVSAGKQTSLEAVDGDDDLLRCAEELPSDVFAKKARKFAAQNSADRGEKLLERQKRDRSAALFTDEETGMGVLNTRLDPISFALLEQAVDNHTDRLWRTDGGRDGQPDEIRTNSQRRADAVFELITGRRAGTHEFLSKSEFAGAKASTQLIVVAEIGAIDGTNPDGSVEIVGTGPVSRSILSRLSPDTELAGMIFSGDGQPLWLGRGRRLANLPQQLAVAVRDGGCVLCTEPMHRCEIHHIEEWDADGGSTDIENLAALCGHHHRWLHNNNRKLISVSGRRRDAPVRKLVVGGRGSGDRGGGWGTAGRGGGRASPLAAAGFSSVVVRRRRSGCDGGEGEGSDGGSGGRGGGGGSGDRGGGEGADCDDGESRGEFAAVAAPVVGRLQSDELAYCPACFCQSCRRPSTPCER